MAKVSEICGILDGLKKAKREASFYAIEEKRKLKAIKIDLEPFRWHDWYQQIWNTIWEFPNLKPEDKPDTYPGLKAEQDPDYFIYETGSEASSSHQMDEYSEEDEGKKHFISERKKAYFHFFSSFNNRILAILSLTKFHTRSHSRNEKFIGSPPTTAHPIKACILCGEAIFYITSILNKSMILATRTLGLWLFFWSA